MTKRKKCKEDRGKENSSKIKRKIRYLKIENTLEQKGIDFIKTCEYHYWEEGIIAWFMVVITRDNQKKYVLNIGDWKKIVYSKLTS